MKSAVTRLIHVANAQMEVILEQTEVVLEHPPDFLGQMEVVLLHPEVVLRQMEDYWR